jgi:hypothetical protein
MNESNTVQESRIQLAEVTCESCLAKALQIVRFVSMLGTTGNLSVDGNTKASHLQHISIMKTDNAECVSSRAREDSDVRVKIRLMLRGRSDTDKHP